MLLDAADADGKITMAAFTLSSLSKCARIFQLSSLQNVVFKASYAKPALGGIQLDYFLFFNAENYYNVFSGYP